MTSTELLAAFTVGTFSGFLSGLLGVSPGGGLVVLSTALLGAGQHLAQGISLLAQIAPTSLSGIKRYRAKGSQIPYRWLIWLGLGFFASGPVGAYCAGFLSDRVLRWSFVAYLMLFLFVVLKVKPNHGEATKADPHPLKGLHLLTVGIIAGFSSGFLGIGGGLAVTVCLNAWLKVRRHQAQMISLLILIIPTTLPAGIVYWNQGQTPSWKIMALVIAGLWFGTDIGARIAVRMNEHRLRISLVIFILALAGYMAFKAVTGR